MLKSVSMHSHCFNLAVFECYLEFRSGADVFDAERAALEDRVVVVWFAEGLEKNMAITA